MIHDIVKIAVGNKITKLLGIRKADVFTHKYFILLVQGIVYIF